MNLSALLSPLSSLHSPRPTLRSPLSMVPTRRTGPATASFTPQTDIVAGRVYWGRILQYAMKPTMLCTAAIIWMLQPLSFTKSTACPCNVWLWFIWTVQCIVEWHYSKTRKIFFSYKKRRKNHTQFNFLFNFQQLIYRYKVVLRYKQREDKYSGMSVIYSVARGKSPLQVKVGASSSNNWDRWQCHCHTEE